MTCDQCGLKFEAVGVKVVEPGRVWEILNAHNGLVARMTRGDRETVVTCVACPPVEVPK